MKSNKGVTITGLIIYVASFLVICGVIGVITTFFYNNSKYLSAQANASAEFDILNAYLANEAKTRENRVTECGKNTEDNSMYIIFSNGNQYIYQKESGEESGKIYFFNRTKKKYFVLCEYVNQNAANPIFASTSGSFTVKVNILGNGYEQTYNFIDQ